MMRCRDFWVSLFASHFIGEPFEEKMARLTAMLKEQCVKARRFNEEICKNLEALGYGG